MEARSLAHISRQALNDPALPKYLGEVKLPIPKGHKAFNKSYRLYPEDNDNFVRNLVTVLYKFDLFKAPRISFINKLNSRNKLR